MIVKDRKFKSFIPKEAIANRVQELGTQICADYADKNPLFVVVLNGAFMFAADLMRKVVIPSQMTFVKFSSYQSMESTGKVDELIGFQEDLMGRHIVIVEDVVDTGITVSEIMAEINKFYPASVEIIALLYKPTAVKRPVNIRYSGFAIENKFVVGYGLDYDGFGRNLEDIFILDESV